MSVTEKRGDNMIKFKSILVILSLFFFIANSFGQKPTQTIRGKVTDSDTELVLVGATVEI